MNKNNIEKIIGFDFTFLTNGGEKKMISFFDFCNDKNAKISIEADKNISFPWLCDLRKINLNFECSGYSIITLNEKTKYIEIADVNIIVPDKVVEVTFTDGTIEKSVCKESDTFSLETAISICISKKIMGGSGAYNNAVKHGMKVYEDKLKKEATEKAEQERIEKKRAKRLAYKERRAAKRAAEEAKRKAQEKEEQIEIQKEAYLRAMDIIRNEGYMAAN